MLRPMIVLTGSFHVAGGERTASERVSDAARKQVKEITSDRRRANVHLANSARWLKTFKVMRTPYGLLVEPTELAALKDMLLKLSKVAAEFNASSTTCRLSNDLLWEPLAGNRRAAVEGWLSRQRDAGDMRAKALLVEAA